MNFAKALPEATTGQNDPAPQNGDAAAGPAVEGDDNPRILAPLRATMLKEIGAMARHVTSGGGQIDRETAALLARIDTEDELPFSALNDAHGSLSAIIAPATPRAIRAMEDGYTSRGWKVIMGPTPELRRLSAANLFFALLFFGVSLSPELNQVSISKSLYEQSGYTLLLKLIFLVAAAGLGASFGALFDVWKEVAKGRFDPMNEGAHWMRIALGVIAGLVMSEIVQTYPATENGQGGISPSVTEPLLAFVGGFASKLVHLITTRIAEAIENVFVGTPGEARALSPGPDRARAPQSAAKDAATGPGRAAAPQPPATD